MHQIEYETVGLSFLTLDVPTFRHIYFVFWFCHQAPVELKKRLDEIRLLESRKSARLADVDTDFARLADMASGDRRRASATIEVPAHHMQGYADETVTWQSLSISSQSQMN